MVNNKENITPKEYLEKIFNGNKIIKLTKNEIRKLIKTFFKDRERSAIIN